MRSDNAVFLHLREHLAHDPVHVGFKGVSFAPAVVRGPGYRTTIEPTDDCRAQEIWNSYLYNVPTPASGSVRITPGSEPTATLDAAKLTKAGAATVYYARQGEGSYQVSVIEYRKTEDVAAAP